MLKRIFPIIAVLVLLVSVFAIPSHALGSGQDGTQVSSALRFDTFAYDSDVLQQTITAPFPFNTGILGGNITQFQYGLGEFTETLGKGYQGTSDDGSRPMIIGSLTLPALSYEFTDLARISFIGGPQFVNLDLLDDYVIGFDPSAIRIQQISVTPIHGYISPNDDDSNYVGNLGGTTQYINSSNGEIRLGDALQAIYASDDIVYLNSIRVDIYFYRTSVATTNFEFEIPTYPGQTQSWGFQSWVADSRLPITKEYGNPVYFDASDWLETAIGGFLSFELVPGFSIDTILYIILVMVVLIWFLKIIK